MRLLAHSLTNGSNQFIRRHRFIVSHVIDTARNSFRQQSFYHITRLSIEVNERRFSKLPNGEEYLSSPHYKADSDFPYSRDHESCRDGEYTLAYPTPNDQTDQQHHKLLLLLLNFPSPFVMYSSALILLAVGPTGAGTTSSVSISPPHCRQQLSLN